MEGAVVALWVYGLFFIGVWFLYGEIMVNMDF